MKKLLYLFVLLLSLFYFRLENVYAVDPNNICQLTLPGGSHTVELQVGTSKCDKDAGSSNVLYSCMSTPGSVQNCEASNQKCWYTDVLHTTAACFDANTSGCANNGTIYTSSTDTWCDNGINGVGSSVKYCKNPAQGIDDTFKDCGKLNERCAMVDPYNKKADCIPRTTDGCDFHGAFYPVGAYFCSDDKNTMLKCLGTPAGGTSKFETAADCVKGSCEQYGMDPQSISCIPIQGSTPMNATDLAKYINNNLECGTLGLKCCDPDPLKTQHRIPQPQIPVLGVGPVDLVFQTFQKYMNVLADPLYNIVNNSLDKFTPKAYCYQGEAHFPDPKNRTVNGCMCEDPAAGSISRLCDNIKEDPKVKTPEQVKAAEVEYTACEKCVNNASPNQMGLWTSLGCLNYNLDNFLRDVVFGMGIGFAGVFALACIIYAAFNMQLSQGDAQKVKKSQELLTSCIMGLMLIIFSVFILRVIGVDILKIPGFMK